MPSQVEHLATAPAATISREQFIRFRDFYYRKTGSWFPDSKRYFVDKRLYQRMAANGCECFDDYFSLLRFSAWDEELQQLINALTVNETYFFREAYQFECMSNHLLEEALDRRPSGSALRIWSVPCATGEEPFSIAIWLLERWPRLRTVDVEIVASDIDTSVIERAQGGVFSKRSLHALPEPYRRKYFEPTLDGRFRLSSPLRESVRFEAGNLIDRQFVMKQGQFDLVFCRNLLIYFDEASRRLAADAIFQALNPGGFVCLGHSESMGRISSLFETRRFPEAIVYRRPCP